MSSETATGGTVELYNDVPARMDRNPVFQKIWGRMHKLNKNYVCAFCGPTGSGKSYSALALAQYLDPDFSIEQVAFTVEEFVQLVNQDYPPGSMIVMDEASVSLDSKTWWDSDQIQIGYILDTWRHQRRGAIMTLPAFDQLQKTAKGRCHALAQTRGIDYSENVVALRYRYIEQDSDTGKIYKKYHTLPDPDSGIEREYSWIGLPLPTQDLRDAYETRKEQYTAELNQEILESVSGADSDGDETAKGIFNRIMANGGPEEYRKVANNGREYIDADLIAFDYEITDRKADKVKKALAREIEGGEGSDTNEGHI